MFLIYAYIVNVRNIQFLKDMLARTEGFFDMQEEISPGTVKCRGFEARIQSSVFQCIFSIFAASLQNFKH